jgi:hypothetical protein
MATPLNLLIKTINDATGLNIARANATWRLEKINHKNQYHKNQLK